MKNLTIKQWNWVLLIILLINSILIGVCFYQLKAREDLCRNNPLIYGAKELTKANNAEFSCVCTINTPNPPRITFDQYGLKVEPIYSSNPSTTKVNFTLIEEMLE